LVGALRHAEHRSVPEIHRELLGRGLNSRSARLPTFQACREYGGF
jgi:hypothetical protein